MPLTLKVLEVEAGGDQKVVWVTVTPSGSYTVGGDTLDLTSMSNPSFFPDPFLSRVPIVPPGVYLEEMNGIYTGILEGTALNNYKMKFYTPGGAEFAATTYASQGITLANFNVAGTTGMKLIIELINRTGL